MEKRCLDNKLYDGKFLDSMNYTQENASKFKDNRVADMSDVYDKMVDIIPNKNVLEEGINYFLEDSLNEDRFYSIGLLLDYAKHRLPEIDIFDYVLKASKQCYGGNKK
jgi:hypothetical protein